MFFYSKKKDYLFLSLINTDLNYKVLKIIKKHKLFILLVWKKTQRILF